MSSTSREPRLAGRTRSPSSRPLPRLPSSSLVAVLAGHLSRPPWSPVVLGGRPLHRLRPHRNSPSLRLQLPWPPLQLRCATTGAHRRAHRCARRRSSPACEQKRSSAQGDAQCCNLRRKKLQLAIGKASTGYEKSFNQYTTGAMDDQEKLQPVTEKASSSDEKSFIRL